MELMFIKWLSVTLLEEYSDLMFQKELILWAILLSVQFKSFQLQLTLQSTTKRQKLNNTLRKIRSDG